MVNGAAIVILADPAGGEESLGRLFNGLAAAWELKQRGVPVQVTFQGAGTRWADVVTRADHPVHALYGLVEDVVAGVSSGCAEVFGARAGAERAGLNLLGANPVPGTTGLPSLAGYLADGYAVLTF